MLVFLIPLVLTLGKLMVTMHLYDLHGILSKPYTGTSKLLQLKYTIAAILCGPIEVTDLQNP